MTKKSITSSSSVDNSSVTSLPVNPPAGAANALLTPNAGNAETVPRTDHAPPEKPPTVMLGQPIPGAKDFHELANLLPMIGTEAFAKLRTDIEKYGLLEPITLWDGKILDGRNREKACRELGIEPKYVEYTGNDPVGFVLSKNAHRRHLTPSQLGMLAVKLAGLSKGRPDLNASAFTQDEAAARLGVSKRILQFAQKVHSEAIPEVATLVEAGLLTVDKAATLAKATPEEQRDAVAAVERGEKCPTFKTQDSKGKNSKESSLENQLSDQLKAALGHPKDSPERSDALIELFKMLIDDAFPKRVPREEFLQGIVAECVEYGVQLPTATA
jgi:ParB-like chromosome segregation protein Spo0J